MEGPTGLAVAAALFVITAIASEAAFEKASRKGDKQIFPAVLGLRLLFGVGIPGSLYGTSRVWASGDIVGVCIGLVMAVAGFVLWPGTVILDRHSAREDKWFGLKKTRIPWSEVSYAGPDMNDLVVVRAKDGRAIQHTQYHVDRAGVIDALKMYFPDCVYNSPNYKPWVPLSSA